MKIRSRPEVKQRCEPIVENALRQLQSNTRNALGNVITLDEHERSLKMIMSSLQMAGIICHYQIGTAVETKQSTYEKNEWLIRLKFTDDATRKTGYIVDLVFHYYH